MSLVPTPHVLPKQGLLWSLFLRRATALGQNITQPEALFLQLDKDIDGMLSAAECGPWRANADKKFGTHFYLDILLF